MSNIEPTEEQRRAVGKLFYELDAHLHGHDIERVARLLAEREHRLRMEYQAPTQDVVIGKLRADLDAARADNAFLRNLFACIATECETGEPDPLTVSMHVRNAVSNSRADARVAEKALDAARARIAELEKALGSRIVSEGELGLLLEASEQREATHLAHIKALRGHVQAAYDRGVEDAHNRGLDIGVTDLLADTAHYDVEGEEEK